MTHAPSQPPLVNLIVPCGGAKLDHAAPAIELYTGSFFFVCMRYALSVVPINQILILSAKHGFVAPYEVIEPYDQQMKRKGAVTFGRLRDQAVELDLIGVPAFALGGEVYADRVAAVIPHITRMIDQLRHGHRGIGEQQNWLTWNLGHLPAMKGTPT